MGELHLIAYGESTGLQGARRSDVALGLYVITTVPWG